MASFSFDSSSAEKREATYELLPAGWYDAQITDSEIIPLKSGNGRALKLTFDVLSEGYRGRKVWARLNIQHSNPEAERIAQSQLRELCESMGVLRFNDTVELHNKPVGIKVKIRKDESGQYSDQNEISAFKPAGGGVAAAPVAGIPSRPSAPPAAPAAAAGGATPPWAKKAA